MKRVLVGLSSCLLLLLPAVLRPGHAQERVLRVCADPNNLPFSHRDETGFENRLARLLASELGASVQYTWWAQRRGFVRNTLRAKKCDVIMGVPSDFELTANTPPYYRSSYVFVSRAERKLALSSLDDPRLHKLRVGVHVVGDDYANTPPVHALARRGVIDNLVGFSLYGDYNEESPPAALVRAVDSGAVDVAIAWGPLAGFFAKRSVHPIELAVVKPDHDGPFPFTFAISVGLRHADKALKEELGKALEARREAVKQLLKDYGTPLVE
jgi:quinoprotein dehydrogenase-associated probable ABC transporter substrate-binding protein